MKVKGWIRNRKYHSELFFNSNESLHGIKVTPTIIGNEVKLLKDKNGNKIRLAFKHRKNSSVVAIRKFLPKEMTKKKWIHVLVEIFSNDIKLISDNDAKRLAKILITFGWQLPEKRDWKIGDLEILTPQKKERVLFELTRQKTKSTSGVWMSNQVLGKITKLLLEAKRRKIRTVFYICNKKYPYVEENSKFLANILYIKFNYIKTKFPLTEEEIVYHTCTV